MEADISGERSARGVTEVVQRCQIRAFRTFALYSLIERGKPGLQAIYPKPKLSKKGMVSSKYPYLLRGLVIDRPNQVWSTDITYIRLRQGFVYLVTIMDWYSRYVLSWEVSNSLDTFFCLTALERALQQDAPEIFNSDQGSQFTSEAFTSCLETAGIRISWDGRVWDNIFVERLWRSVKYEEVVRHITANQECQAC